jgi:hypothetical protein
VDDLVGVAAEQELPLVAERREGESQLDGGDVLDLVDDQEVVDLLRARAPLPGRHVRVEEAALLEVAEPAQEDRVDRAALLSQEDRLPDAELEVLGLAEPGGVDGRAREHTLDLLVDAVRVLQPEEAAHPAVPGGEVGPGGFPPRRHLDRLQQLGEAEEVDLLAHVRVAARVVERAGVLHEVGGARQVEPVPGDRLQLLEGEGRLPAARGADHDERERGQEDGRLRVVEGERLVEEVEGGGARVHVGQRLGRRVPRAGRGHGLEVVLGVAAPVQEAGPRVVVVEHDLEDEQPGAAAVPGELEEEAVLVVELRPVEAGAPQLLDLRRAEVAPPELLEDVLVLAGRRPRVEVPEDQGLHHRRSLRRRRTRRDHSPAGRPARSVRQESAGAVSDRQPTGRAYREETGFLMTCCSAAGVPPGATAPPADRWRGRA